MTPADRDAVITRAERWATHRFKSVEHALIADLLALVRSVCPHCELPAVLPVVCTPELHRVIERNIARDWDLFNAGYAHGKAERESRAQNDES